MEEEKREFSCEEISEKVAESEIVEVKYSVEAESPSNSEPSPSISEPKKEEDIITVPACLEEKNYNKEYIYVALLVVLSVGGALIAAFVPAYMVAGIVIAVLSVIAAVALVRHIFECKKISKLVTSGECQTITALMQKTGKARKPEFVRTVGGMIKDGHLVGYALVDDEKFAARTREGAEENVKS